MDRRWKDHFIYSPRFAMGIALAALVIGTAVLAWNVVAFVLTG